VYDILNYMTDDNLFTHQLPRACRECEPWLKSQYPRLFSSDPQMEECLRLLDEMLEAVPDDSKRQSVEDWVKHVKVVFALPDLLSVEQILAGSHGHIDPIEEAIAMKGQDSVIVVELEN